MRLRRDAFIGVAVCAAILAATRSPVSTHVRAVALLERFQDPKSPPPVGLRETPEAIDDPGHPPIRARLYQPAASGAAVVLVPGVHHLGLDEPRLVRFARALAASGVTVLTPEVRELIDYRIEGASADEIGLAARAFRRRLGAPVGVMGMSFAGGLSLLAASDARFAPDIAFVVAIGAHDDLARVSRFFATNEIPRPDGSMLRMAAHPYGPSVLVYDRLEDFFPATELPVARDALRLWLWEEKDAARTRARELPPPSQAKLSQLFDDDLHALAPELLKEIDAHETLMAAASPHGHLSALRAPVFLLHGSGDAVIPASETLWIARDAPAGLVHGLLVSPAVVHVELEGEPRLREKWSLVHFMADVLGAASNRGASGLSW